ncbi:BRISC and BRCA1-A complex member 1-like [Uloborus diversus]|uniref:BRISC and BRCA1-A complex member 1-like n=1 Tax=Uloborus diversus TaxID=327109 RepID=UPI002409653E|nr:BRISC and BRCA1-A complex member 1-like [Uloborus diversus]
MSSDQDDKNVCDDNIPEDQAPKSNSDSTQIVINPETTEKCDSSSPCKENVVHEIDLSNIPLNEAKLIDSTYNANILKALTEPQIKASKDSLKTEKVFASYVHPCVPKINRPEKIVFCLDMSSDMEQIPFRFGDGSEHSPLSMIKRTIELFVENKHFLNRKHEYSLMVLYETATWVREFTNDPKELIDSLEDLNETQACDSCDLSSIVSLLTNKYELKIPSKVSLVTHIYRVILIYGRSNCVTTFSSEESKHILMKHPLLFLDVMYIHETPSDQNKSQQIYEMLCDLDEQNKSYIFEVIRNTTKLHNCMAKLLAHPLQRSAQKDANYKIRFPCHK